MKQQAGVWQNEGSLVFKLKETNRSVKDKDTGEYKPELTNDIYFQVHIQNVGSEYTPAGNAMREVIMAEKLAALLNEQNVTV